LLSGLITLAARRGGGRPTYGTPNSNPTHADARLGARRRGVGDHGLEHVGGHDDRLAALAAALHDARLPERHLRARARLGARPTAWEAPRQGVDALVAP